MIIVFWILAILLVAGFTYFTIRIIIMRYAKKYRRWGRVLTDNLIIEEKSFIISESLTIKGWSYGSTDFIDYEPSYAHIEFTKDLEDTTKVRNITRALVARGFTRKEIAQVLGENFLRVISEVCG